MLSPPLSLYVHLPWCVRKCPYCDFNSHAVKDSIPESAYVKALLNDLELELNIIGDKRELQTIFIGGGTPSLFSADSIHDLIDGIAKRTALSNDAEITMEANPGTVEFSKFKAFRDVGVNRLSIGVQSFNDDALKRLDRIHSGSEAVKAIQAAQDCGFSNFNIDLMYGLPDQQSSDALTDIRQAIALSPTHISAYQLTIEPNTYFHRYPPELPDDDLIWDMQQSINEQLDEAGYFQYEISAYSQTDKFCRHNINYWQFGDYIGIGAGAHGKITIGDAIRRRWKVKHPLKYLQHSGSVDSVGGERLLDRSEIIFEFMLNALRLKNGFSLNLFEQATGLSRTLISTQLREGALRGWLNVDEHNIVATEKGYQFLNDVIELFLFDTKTEEKESTTYVHLQ